MQVEVAVLQTPLSEQPASSVQLPETAPTKSTATIKIFIIIMRRFFLVEESSYSTEKAKKAMLLLLLLQLHTAQAYYHAYSCDTPNITVGGNIFSSFKLGINSGKECPNGAG